MHKFLSELLNVSRMALLGLMYAWFTSGDAEELYYYSYRMEILEIFSYGHYHIIYGVYT
jgi:hypothetical protein